jgi:peptidoglycan/LPS O-acetylase OafA/YrhL
VFVVLQNQGAGYLRLLRTRVGKFFAKISYPFYLVHIAVLDLVFIALHGPQGVGSWRGIALAGLSFMISIAICALSHRILEKPMIDFAHGKFTFAHAEKPPRSALA